MPDKEALEEYLEEKRSQFREASDAGDIDSLYELNMDIEDALSALYS